MKPVLGTVVTENRGGGGGVTGAAEVARAQPDGHTFLFGNTSTQVLIPAIMHNPPYDPLKDFVGDLHPLQRADLDRRPRIGAGAQPRRNSSPTPRPIRASCPTARPAPAR